MPVNPEDMLTQFSRLLLLPDFDEQALESIRKKKVGIIGLGGLGCPVALYLAQSGVAKIVLVDNDLVSLSNLPRQVLYGPQDVGQPKAKVLANQLSRIAPQTLFEPIYAEATESLMAGWFAELDLVLDCTDRFLSRQAINRACFHAKRILISASALQWSGQMLVVDPNQPDAGCYACLFDPRQPTPDAACGAFGVFSTAVGIVGLLQANEALKVLMGQPPAAGRLLLVNAKEAQIDVLRLNQRLGCTVCRTPAAD